METIATSWQCGKRVLSLESPIIVGILNVTPDSFSDGGDYASLEEAVSRAEEIESEGATIIDIGGESTRPGAIRVGADEQIRRVVPVIEEVRNRSDVLISIDTTLSQVAAVAIDAGATIINDVSAGMEDEEMFPLARRTGSGLVLMHRRLPPEMDNYSNEYEQEPDTEDVVQDVIDVLMDRVSTAVERHGVQKNTIALDPGLGFGKSVTQNWQLVHEINRITELGYPVYVGASRKSFIGANVGLDIPKLRDEASVEVAKKMADSGAQIFRVHNVSGHVRVLQSHLAQPEP
tara:strand:- start:402 stop:1271 length:870 start_codon:yes stop_codon:yes gene_type:complete